MKTSKNLSRACAKAPFREILTSVTTSYFFLLFFYLLSSSLLNRTEITTRAREKDFNA